MRRAGIWMYKNGGGMEIENCAPTIANCTFSGNSADESGGGMVNYNSTTTINNCTFHGNTATGTSECGGGGMFNHSSNSIITNCIFYGNTVTAESDCGGAGMLNASSNPTLANCIFYGNTVTAKGDCVGGGILNVFSNPIITNCTIVGNTVSATEGRSAGGGIGNCTDDDPATGSDPSITNCIIRDNTALYEAQIFTDEFCTPSITYCNVNGGHDGEGNIDQAPRFLDPEDGDFHLQAGSPCIDAGTDTVQLPDSDFEGGPRILGAAVDMGVDEAFVSSTGMSIGVGVVSDGNMTACSSIDPATLPDDPNKPEDLPYGLIEIVIQNADSGGTAVVKVSLPEPAPADHKWYKYTSAGNWIDFSREPISGSTGDGAEFNDDRTEVTLYITDNGEYDDDPTAGTIKDPSGLAAPASTDDNGGGDDGDDNGGGCFIATAVYGSGMADDVVALKEFRDNILLKNSVVRSFVRLYYKLSPPLADYIKEHETLKTMVRIGLMPFVAVSYSTLHFGPAITLTIFVVLLVIPIFLVSFHQRKARSYKADN